jgi:hypothetical protein
MSDSLASSFYSAYQGFNPPIEASEDATPSYMPRAEITFPAFAALPDIYDIPAQDERLPDSRPVMPAQGALPALEAQAGQQMDSRADSGNPLDGYGRAPFIENNDSNSVFDSVGNIFTDGGDTSDWADVGYTALRLSGMLPFAEGGMVDSEPEAFAKGGLIPLEGGGKVAIGPGGGLDDLIPTSINGRRAAALSDGEFVIPADVVSMMGDGSSNAGARRLYDLVKQVRDNKTGTTRQAGPLPVGDILKRSLS